MREFRVTFKYQNRYTMAVAGPLFVALIAGLGGILIARDKYAGDILVGTVFLLVVAPLLGLLIMNALYGLSDVTISEAGICRVFFGKKLQHILWPNVKKIRLLVAPTFTLRGAATTFCIDQTEAPRSYFRKSGGVFFGEEVNDIGLLIKILNHYAHEYKIPIYSGYQQNQARLDTIRLTDCALASRNAEKKHRR